MEPTDLGSARKQIDQIDEEIVALLNRRARLALDVGAAKNAAARATYAPDREHEVLENVKAVSQGGPLTDRQITAIYRQIISACRSLERAFKIAFMGPAASFTHQAALERFGENTDLIAVASIPDTFAEVARGSVDFGVVPVENSTEGPVQETLDNFVDSDLKICAEIVLRISFNLLSKGEKGDIKRVYTNPVALGQCRQWLAKNLPGIEVVTVVSNSRAAAIAAEEPTSAALAGTLAAQEYGLNILESEVQDLAANFTRFYVIAPSASATSHPTGSDKTAVAFSIRDRVGALRDVVDVFTSAGINMSSIQSRPSKRRVWDYVFFVEFAGHEGEPRVREALEELKSHTVFVKVLGSWPVDN